jgi:pyrimidine deaminase RibD-like protein
MISLSLSSKEQDSEFMSIAIRESKESRAENGGPHPRVGVVVVKQGVIIEKAHRGEFAQGDHAEYTLLEKKLRDEDLTGATLYTTLEPCNKRGPEKTPCAGRIVMRRIGRVVIGILDPNPSVQGKGMYMLKRARIAVDIINDPRLENEIEELNRDFVEAQRAQPIETREYRLAHRTSISDEFRDCRDAAITFHNCDIGNVENLLAIKYESFMRRRSEYPRMFFQARRKHWDSRELVAHLQEILAKSGMSHGSIEEVIREYVKRQYEIDAAVIAHLELRKRFNEAVFQDELMELVGAYDTRLHMLFYDDLPFGRSDVNEFFNESHIYMLLNTPEEKDAIKFIDSFLTCAL